MHVQATRIKSLKNYFLTSGVFPDYQNQVLKKDIFQHLEWLKTCFDAFPGHQIQVFKKIFFNIGTCFDAFPDHQNQVLEVIF
jgi:hypothetical protein